MKIAILGCGMISDTHVQEIRKIPGATIVGVCDSQYLMAKQLADRYDIPQYYSHVEDLLEHSKPDVVHILTPPPTHQHLILTVLDAGCHVFVEKPLTINIAQTRQVIEKAKLTNRKITVNHFHNFSPSVIRLKKIMAKGILGNIIHIESFYGYTFQSEVALEHLNNRNSWLYGLPGNFLQNNISHLLSKISEFIPDDDPKILAFAKRLSSAAKKVTKSYIHDELRVIIGGRDTTAYATFSANISPLMQFMVIYGTNKTVSIDYESRTITFSEISRVPGAPGKLVSPFRQAKQYFLEGSKNAVDFAKARFHYYSGMNTLLKSFYTSIKNNADVPIPYHEIIRLQGLMDEIFRQINEKENSSVCQQ